jgi:hypothetical protein
MSAPGGRNGSEFLAVMAEWNARTKRLVGDVAQ